MRALEANHMNSSSRWIGAASCLSLLLTAACSEGPSAPVAKSAPALQLELRVAQRSTTPVPGTEDGLKVTIDDITKGQTMLTLIGVDGAEMLGPQSVQAGAVVPFVYQGIPYRLIVVRLDNRLVGTDYATVRIEHDPHQLRSEAEKIEFLIESIASLEGATFVRNGAEHSPAEAARHLRRKLESAGNRVQTVDDFITHLGSHSSFSRQPYRLVLPDGTSREVGDYLRSIASGLESQSGAPLVDRR